MPIGTVQLTTVHVMHQQAAVDFFVDRLGFEKMADDSIGATRFVVVAPTGESTGILVESAEHAGVDQIGGFTGIVFGADDVHGTYDELVAAGVDFLHEPTKDEWGRLQALFKDPDGNVYMLHERVNLGA